MGELINVGNKSVSTEQKTSAAAAHIMAVCRVVTPQFYKGQTDVDLKAEKAAIEMLTTHIDAEVMKKMCELAVQNYGTARSDNGRVFFDVNYVLTFYRAAFNWYWCESVELSLEADRLGDSYDPTTRIITERWRDGGREITVKYIADEDYNETVRKHSKNGGWGRYYTPAYWEWNRRDNDRRNDVEFEKMRQEREAEEAEARRIAALTPEQVAQEKIAREQAFEKMRRDAEAEHRREESERRKAEQAQAERERQIQEAYKKLKN